LTCGWLGIVAGAVVFAAALALRLNDAALLLTVALLVRGGRMIFERDASGEPAAASLTATPGPRG
jgi:hypothetical protein